AFSPDSKRIVFPGESGDVKVWDVQSQRLLDTLPTTAHKRLASPRLSIAHSRDGKTVAIAGPEAVYAWDGARREQVVLAFHEQEMIKYSPASVAFSPEGKLLAATGAYWRNDKELSYEIKIWETTGWKPWSAIAEVMNAASRNQAKTPSKLWEIWE